MFSNLNLSDMETCYKLFRTDIIQSSFLKKSVSVSSPKLPPNLHVLKILEFTKWEFRIMGELSRKEENRGKMGLEQYFLS